MIKKTYCEIISNLQKSCKHIIKTNSHITCTDSLICPISFTFCARVHAHTHTHTHTLPLVFFLAYLRASCRYDTLLSLTTPVSVYISPKKDTFG